MTCPCGAPATHSVEKPMPRLLDLFCGAGGAAMGYHRAGFEVVGVDIKPQPHYPFEFHQADALTYPLDGFDAIHASPPCQHYSAGAKAAKTVASHTDLYQDTRQKLITGSIPWVIENIIGAPYGYGVVLCGSMFNLRVRRHRNFETSWLIFTGLRCEHSGDRPITITTRGEIRNERGIVDYKHSRHAPTAVGASLMGMPWATSQHEIGEAIPPAYTEYIGKQLMAHIGARIWRISTEPPIAWCRSCAANLIEQHNHEL